MDDNPRLRKIRRQQGDMLPEVIESIGFVNMEG
jgi:hypothetical protein